MTARKKKNYHPNIQIWNCPVPENDIGEDVSAHPIAMHGNVHKMHADSTSAIEVKRKVRASL